MSEIRSFRESGERHSFLRVLAGICRWFGMLLLVLSLITLIVSVGILTQLAGNQSFTNLFVGSWVFGFWVIGLFAAGVQSIAVGSFFVLAIQVEENTRATAQALDRLTPTVDLKRDLDPREMFLS
jgi:hypothetical protein